MENSKNRAYQHSRRQATSPRPKESNHQGSSEPSQNSEKKDDAGSSKSRNVGGWAKATEYVAKALGAVVGLAAAVFWNFGKRR